MEILKVGNAHFWENDHLMMNLMLNTDCNFKCSYCCNRQMRNTRQVPQLDFNILKKLLDDVYSLKRDRYYFITGGGEPALYKHLYDFFKILEEKCENNTSVQLSTNGSLLDTFIPIIEDSPNVGKVIGISIHESEMSIEKYKERIKNFKYPEYLVAKFMLQPGALDVALDFKNFAESIGTKCTIVGLTSGRRLLPDYTEEELEVLNKYQTYTTTDDLPNEFSILYEENGKQDSVDFKYIDVATKAEFMNYDGMLCLAGRNMIAVTPEAKVFRCHRDNTGVQFNLHEHSILEYPNLLKIQPCTADRCFTLEVALPKWKKGLTPPHYISNKMLAE